ncbi:hypothetical protein [Ramlibacter sp. AN1133]|uniref:hypothetical protein n=1 Tax=Ramlibacter sp. AN1133 TaxID=3133429 RepID=UPI0030BB72FB
MPALSDSVNLFARRFARALQRETRLPPVAGAADEDLARGSDRHRPGAGAVVGLLAAFVFAVFGLLLRGNPAGPAVAAVASLFAVLVLTGAAHERAVFRLAESLAPGAGQGVIAMVVLLAARIVAVAAIGSASEPGVLAALLAGPVVSRFAPLLAAHWAAHAGGEDAGTVRIAALWCVVPVALMVLADGAAFALLALAGAAAAWIALLRFFRHRSPGFDEARAAALQQACEAAFYLAASLGA